ncbi:MAG: hypothetical protein WCS70_00935 [Verrucomicrobiota bacterium]
MSTIQEIKLAAEHLSARERLELSEWLAASHEVQRLRLQTLRADIAVGIAQANRGDLGEGDAVFRRLKQGR